MSPLSESPHPSSSVSNNARAIGIRFSIIIPALNEEETIGRCLESLQKLDYPLNAFEVILIDNGSQDRTVEVANAHAGELALKVLVQTHGRVTSLRNLGYRHARGEFLAFLDADCVVPQGWLRFAEQVLSDGENRVVGGHCGIPGDSSRLAQAWYGDWQTRKCGDVSYIPAANLLIQKSAFGEIGGFDESLETNEEVEFCQRAREKRSIVFAYPELGVVHFRAPQSLSAFFQKQAWHGKHVFKVFLRNFPSRLNIRPVSFAIYTALTLLAAAASLVTAHFTWFALFAGLLMVPPVVLSAGLVIQRRRGADFPALVLLHLAYGIGRASALIDPRNWLSDSKTSERVTAGRSRPEQKRF
jgi:glycosyltransferase involved in cell wall biosynthesis